MRVCRLCFQVLTVALVLPAQDIREFEKRVTEFTLGNGLHFILVERHDAPVVSFHTYVSAGSVNDPSGETGVAHILEHMAFKGTETIGSKNWADEKKAMDAIEEIYDRLDAERSKGAKADKSRVETLGTQLSLAADRAQLYSTKEFSSTIEDSGGQGLNVATGYGATESSYSLPSNRIELWFLMESQRLLHPVFRDFYREREAMLDEYRQQVDSKAQGKLTQSVLSTAFAAHPYKNPSVGWPSDIVSIRRADARAFFEKYYVPANIVVAIVGDVNTAEARRLAERYLGPMPNKALPPPLHTFEPPQPGSKTAVVELSGQPMAMVAYKRPDQYDKDDAVFDAIQLILAGGRSGLLYKEMVEGKRISASVQSVATFPDGRYINLFAFLLVPSAGHTVDENDKALDDVLARFKAKPVDAETLQRAKSQARGRVLRNLANNNGLARLMSLYYANYGDWRKLFTALDALNKVTAEDVQRVAQMYFISVNRTLAYTAPPRSTAVGGRP